MFTLAEYTPDERREAALYCGVSFMYLGHFAKGLRSPSLKVAERLMAHDSRLTVSGLLEPKRRRQERLKAEQEAAKQAAEQAI